MSLSSMSIYDIEKLEIAKKLICEVQESQGYQDTDYHPELTLPDAISAIDELLQETYPDGYIPPSIEMESTIHYRGNPFKDTVITILSEFSGLLIIISALSACTSIICWGISDFKGAFGHKQQPDFTAQSQLYKGAAIASLGLALTCSVVGGVIKGDEK